jgi:predicted alpha/beta hydrolase family esterase
MPDKDKEYYNPKEPSASNAQWLPWLQKQLTVHDIKADTPEVPFAFKPQWDLWVREVERFEITPETLLVGHSCGGGFWVRYLSEHPEIYVGTVVLVAPWLNLGHEEDISFFDFEIDPGIVARAKKFVIFASDNDMQVVTDSSNFLRDKIPEAKFREFHNYGHFCSSDMKTNEFPELLEELL